MTGSRSTEIADVVAWEALDSRGRPTVACRVHLAGGAVGRAIVPSGASTGSHEAVERRDGGMRYGGWGVRGAVEAVRAELRPAVIGLDATCQVDVDRRLEEVDGTPDLRRAGANAVLAVSLATAIAGARALGQPLWKSLAGPSPLAGDPTAGDPTEPVLLPMPMVNILSGGAHAARAIDIQDVLAVPVGAGTFAYGLELVERVRAATAALLDSRGDGTGLVADEGGLAAPLPTNEAALALVTDGIEAAGLTPGHDVALAVDLAASQFGTADGTYHLRCEDRVLDRDGWLAEVGGWCERYPIVSLEDVLNEDDWEGWTLAARTLPGDCQLLGDDLFATHLERVEKGIACQAANAVLVKPNQAGTLTRAQRVLRRAQQAGLATVVSARSGDTEDTWLADLAVGWRSGQIKVGSTTRSERTAKWNRLLELERDLGEAAVVAHQGVLRGQGY
ncbi:phosphopyruvate hydratase [Actinopolymorpha sp. B17G11]|uniref:phosphopyruvate hydratase n=1 Tax=unclassified Actinopolymorpha TaxID=2627063 RepID=UPI0032D99C7A